MIVCFACRLDCAAGVKAALAIYDQVLTALQRSAPAAQQAQRAAPADAAVERLCVWRGALLVEASARGLACAAPGAVREALLASLRWFPASRPLLQVGVDGVVDMWRVGVLAGWPGRRGATVGSAWNAACAVGSDCAAVAARGRCL